MGNIGDHETPLCFEHIVRRGELVVSIKMASKTKPIFQNENYSFWSSGFLPGVILLPRGHLAMSEDIVVVTTWGVLLASSEQRPERMLHILKRTGQPPS